MLSIIIQLLIIGTLQGGIYALAAFGLSLIFGVSNVLNLAHGQFLMLGGLLTFVLFTATKWNPLLLSLILTPLFFAMGYLFEKGLIRPLFENNLYRKGLAGDDPKPARCDADGSEHLSHRIDYVWHRHHSGFRSRCL